MRVMASLTRQASQSMDIRNVAVHMVQHLQQKDFRGEACVLLTFVRDQIRYVRDMHVAEVLQYPQITLSIRAGDCDDKSTLLGALLMSIGHRVRFIALSQLPNMYSHVWLQVFVGGKWLDLEPTEPVPCGSRVPSAGVLAHLTQEV